MGFGVENIVTLHLEKIGGQVEELSNNTCLQ